ncbi:MAG: peptidylprolyl isomerase [Bacteroidales bacterium]
MTQVKKGDTVKVHYTGKLTDGTVFDSSEGREPLQFTVGDGRLIRGFDEGVVGMEVNESRTVEIKSEDAYGPVRDDLFVKVPMSQLPEGLKPEVGMELISQQPDGQEIIVTVKEVQDDSVLIDANHRLAGQDLVFDITLVEIA